MCAFFMNFSWLSWPLLDSETTGKRVLRAGEDMRPKGQQDGTQTRDGRVFDTI